MNTLLLSDTEVSGKSVFVLCCCVFDSSGSGSEEVSRDSWGEESLRGVGGIWGNNKGFTAPGRLLLRGQKKKEAHRAESGAKVMTDS